MRQDSENFTSINSFVMTLWYTFYSFSHFTGEKNYETEIRLLAKCQMPKPTVRLRWSSLGTDVQTPHLVFCIKLRQNISYHVSPSLNSLLFQGGISPGPGQEAHQRALGHTRNVTGDFWMALQSSRIGPCYQPPIWATVCLPGTFSRFFTFANLMKIKTFHCFLKKRSLYFLTTFYCSVCVCMYIYIYKYKHYHFNHF